MPRKKKVADDVLKEVDSNVKDEACVEDSKNKTDEGKRGLKAVTKITIEHCTS